MTQSQVYCFSLLQSGKGWEVGVYTALVDSVLLQLPKIPLSVHFLTVRSVVRYCSVN